MNTKPKRTTHVFWEGLWRGLSSPVVVFQSQGLSEIKPFTPVHPVSRTDRDALREDWENVGGDFRVAIKKVRQENAI